MTDIRKIVTLVEEIRLEAGRAVDPPVRRVATAAVIANPFAGRYQEDLTELIEASVELGRTISTMAVAALDGRPVHGYGKGAIVGMRGELEHAAAMLHPEFGAPLREATGGGKAIIPSAKKRGAAGVTLDIPLHYKDAAFVRSHFDAIEIRIVDAPADDELVIAVRRHRRRPPAPPGRRPPGVRDRRRGRAPLTVAGDLVVRNIGTIVTGDIRSPIAEGDTIVVRDGLIASVGSGDDAGDIAATIDAAGATVVPGLCDDHVHPVLGDYTPRQQQLDWIDSCLHGGVTTMLSAGEPHLPGRPTDPAGVKALAILAHRSFANLRPSGVKVHAGAVLLEEGLTEADFAEMAAAGVHLVGEIGISGVKDPETAERMARWAQASGMTVMVHTGGASIPGSGIIGADFVVAVRPDVAAHTNGGPTALPLDHVERILSETDARVEVVHNGNVRAAGEVAALVERRGELERLVVGTDSPAGSGVQPLGMLRTVSFVASLGNVAPELAIAAATGNVAAMHGLNTGVLAPGREADLLVVDAPLGSQAEDALGALAIGDTPAVATAVIDGIPRFAKSRNTPPPVRAVTVS